MPHVRERTWRKVCASYPAACLPIVQSDSSWQAYVDNNLMCPLDEAGTTLSSAALAGLEDGSIWAQSPDFPGFSAEEVSCLSLELPASSHSDHPSLPFTTLTAAAALLLMLMVRVLLQLSTETGCIPNGVPRIHVCLQIEAVKKIMDGNNPGSFTVGGKKYMVLFSEDPATKLRGKCQGGGCSICKTNQALIVGIWAEPVSASTCNKVRVI